MQNLRLISKLLDLNTLARFTYFPSLMGMDVSSENGITIVNSGIPCNFLNLAFEVKSKQGINVAIKKIHDLRMPFAFWIGSDNDYPQCKEDLEKMAIVCNERGSGMFMEIGNLPHDKKCNELQISLIDDKQKVEDMIEVCQQSFSDCAEQLKEFHSKSAEYICDPNSKIKYFVGYYFGQPVAVSSLCIEGDVAGIWDVTTIPKFRRKGIATDMTSHALFYAFDNFGHRIGVLTASEEGEPVYQKIGFRKLKDFFVFNVDIEKLREI